MIFFHKIAATTPPSPFFWRSIIFNNKIEDIIISRICGRNNLDASKGIRFKLCQVCKKFFGAKYFINEKFRRYLSHKSLLTYSGEIGRLFAHVRYNAIYLHYIHMYVQDYSVCRYSVSITKYFCYVSRLVNLFCFCFFR